MCIIALGVALFSSNALAHPARQSAESKAQTAEDLLKDRVKTFYKDILKNDRVAALEFVAPESKNQFLNTHFDGLVDVRIASIEFAQSHDQATVKVIRTMRVASFSSQPLDLQVNDTWGLTNSQWYLKFPPAGEVDTPFGKMKFSSDSSAEPTEVSEMKQRIEKAYKNVDPDQYIRALQKVAGSSGTDVKAGGKEPTAATRADNKKTGPATPPAPTTDSSKPQL